MPIFTPVIRKLVEDLHHQGRMFDDDYRAWKQRFHREDIWAVIVATVFIVSLVTLVCFKIAEPKEGVRITSSSAVSFE
jgi:ABC-type Fe3+ transport system permease subunit